MMYHRLLAIVLVALAAPCSIGSSPRNPLQTVRGAALSNCRSVLLASLSLLGGAGRAARATPAPATRLPALESDELVVQVTDDYMGLGLKEVQFGDVNRCLVSSIQANSSLASTVSTGMILVALNDIVVEGASRDRIADKIATLGRPLSLTLRDPSAFFNLLNSTLGTSVTPITTTIAPATNSKEKRVLSVQRTRLAPGTGLRTVHIGDVVELSILRSSGDEHGEAVHTTSLADSSFLVAGDGSDAVATALLPPVAQLALSGMRVGEERRIRCSGDDVEFFFVKLLSINGEATDEVFDISTAK